MQPHLCIADRRPLPPQTPVPHLVIGDVKHFGEKGFCDCSRSGIELWTVESRSRAMCDRFTGYGLLRCTKMRRSGFSETTCNPGGGVQPAAPATLVGAGMDVNVPVFSAWPKAAIETSVCFDCEAIKQ